MKGAYLHGLESPPKTIKNEYLSETFEFVYDPPMNYNDPELFDTILAQLQKEPVDLIIGSSMGGYFAYHLSTLTGINTLLFNPAFVSHSINPVVKTGLKKAKHTVVLGTCDYVIDPIKSLDFMRTRGFDADLIHLEKIEHQIPLDVYKKYVNNFMK